MTKTVPAYVLIPPFSEHQIEGLQEVLGQLDAQSFTNTGHIVVVDEGNERHVPLRTWLTERLTDPANTPEQLLFYERLFKLLNP